MVNQDKKQQTSKEGKNKKNYAQPRLQEYGTIAKLTAGPRMPGVDGTTPGSTMHNT